MFSPNTLVLSFAPPSSVFVSELLMGSASGGAVDLRVDGKRWFHDESPLIVQGDVLRDNKTNVFAGMAFPIMSPDWQLPLVCEMIKGLDPNVIRIFDTCEKSIKRNYNNSLRNKPYLEVLWHQSLDYTLEFGQLLFGAWAFGYPIAKPSLFRDPSPWTVPYGFIVPNVKKLLQEFSLCFPDQLPGRTLTVTPWETERGKAHSTA